IVCVGLSGGRSAEVLAHRERTAKEINNQRASILATIRTIEAEANDLQDQVNAADEEERALQRAAAAECATGKGSKCEGKTSSFEAARERTNRLREQAFSKEQQLRAEKD